MWSPTRSTSHGGFSVRSVFTYALTALVAVLFLTILISPQTHAADATWNGQTISFHANNYIGPADATLIKELSLPTGTQAYTYVDPAANTVSTNPNTNGSSSNSPPSTTRQMHVIYFAAGTDVTKATSASYMTYTYLSPTSVSTPSATASISIDAQTAASTKTSSCVVDGGIGWIVCPITNFLANGMDWIFNVLTGFLTVQPPQTGQDNSLYRAWSYMRNIANVAFVISFLIIIYSQISNLGIDNYSIKKLLPRLIIAAVLVNMSYIVCSVAIDISNILGYSIQDIFISLRNTLVGPEGNSWNVTSWQSVSGFILSGGTAITAGSIGLFTTLTTYGIAGSLILLLPALVGGLVAVLIALIIMAARQALVIILVIIAPLAFVAYLLPNTEKWFERWCETFITMLIIFPAFSVVFGGSQLAGIAIIQNADSINLILLGMIVQVAPLFITPLLIRFSGSVLGRVAGLINDPKKGLVDRTRAFSQDRAENIKARRIGQPARPHQFLRRGAQWRDGRRRYREGWRAANTNLADGRWANDARFQEIDQTNRFATDLKTVGEKDSEYTYLRSKARAGQVQTLDDRLRIANSRVERATDQRETQWYQNTTPNVVYEKVSRKVAGELLEVAKKQAEGRVEIMRSAAFRRTAEYAAFTPQMRRMIDTLRDTTEDLAIGGMTIESAKRVQQNELGVRLEQNLGLRQRAGASNIDPNGAQRAMASALSVIKRAREETIANADAIIDRGNLNDAQTLQLALGHDQVGSNGVLIEATPEVVEAAITRTTTAGSEHSILELSENLDFSPGSDENHRLAFVEGMRKNNAGRPKFFGMTWLDGLTGGVAGGLGRSGIDLAVQDAVNAKKFSAGIIVAQDKDVLARIDDTIARHGTGYFTGDALQDFKKQIVDAYKSDEYKGLIGERDTALRQIMQKLDRAGVTYPTEAADRPQTTI